MASAKSIASGATTSGQATLEAKVVLLGSQGVGKTSLVVQFTQGQFLTEVTSTIGASFFTHKMNVDNCAVKLQLWDTAGQERFRSMAPMYYRGANAALLVYDVTNPMSFEHVKGWVTELTRHLGDESAVDVLYLVGNKTDLRTPTSVPYEQGATYARSINAFFGETSAKDNTGIHEAFLKITQELMKKRGISTRGRSISVKLHDAPGDGDADAPVRDCKCAVT